MKEANNESPADATASSLGSICDGNSGGGVAVAANRPTPSPAAVVAAAASAPSSSSSNAAIEAKSETKASVEIVTKNESRDDVARNDGSGQPTCSLAAAPLPSSTNNISTISMSLQKSEDGTAVSYRQTKFTPIRSVYSIVSQSIGRGSGNSIVATPGPTTSRSMDTNLLGQEMLAASAAASEMMDGYDYDEFGLNLNGASPLAATMTHAPPLHEANFVHHYPRQDDYALPPFLQAHLDETYAASSSSSTLVLPPISTVDDIENGHPADFMFQMTSYHPNLTATSPFKVTALGTAPPNPTGRRVAVNNGNVHTSGSSSSNMAPLARAKKMAAAPTKTSAFFTSTSSTKNRSARSLPLRKRPVKEEEEEPEMETVDTKEHKVVKKSSNRPRGPSTKKPSVKKPTLVRHNYNDNRSTCKCAKSRCLKLYCDCFQSGRMCDPAECECKSCMNLEQYCGPSGTRTKAIGECLAKNPKAFEKRQKSVEEGCGCKRNKCLKKYCVCFNAGAKCDESCRCKNCENQDVGAIVEEGHGILTSVCAGDVEVKAKSEVIVEEPPTKYVKVASMGGRLANASSITESSDSPQESHTLPYPPRPHLDSFQIHNFILGDYIYGRELNQMAPGSGEVESNFVVEI